MSGRVGSAYYGSDAEQTRALYRDLATYGPLGVLAVHLLQALKASVRAKRYRGAAGRGQPRYRRLAYDKKIWAIGEVVRALAHCPQIRYGWAMDTQQPFYRHVLYVDLPTGQVSFHMGQRGAGPTYVGLWDGTPMNEPRIVSFGQHVLDGTEPVYLAGIAHEGDPPWDEEPQLELDERLMSQVGDFDTR